MEKTKFIFHSGLDTIGAVILEIRYGKDRIFLEAGTVYNPEFDMFDGKVTKRNNFINDYLWVNEIPSIDGIYRKKDILKYNLKSINECSYNQAFFITHLHLDHMRMMGLIAPNVPIYLTKQAQIIEFALEDVGLGIDTIRDNYLDIPDEVNIGKIKVKKFIINDDSYQDLSFYIETPDIHIHYTGDVFAYGKYQTNLLKEIEHLNKEKVDILFCEGTQFWANVSKEKLNYKHQFTEDYQTMMTKEEFDDFNIKLLKDYPGLVILNYYEREMSDVADYLNFSKKAGRTLVFEPKSAYVINKFFNIKLNVLIPDTYTDEPNYLNYVKENNIILNKENIIANPTKFIVQNTYENLLELFDYRNIKTMYLHHSGIPLGDFDPKMNKLKTIVKACNFDYQSSKFDGTRLFNSHAPIPQLLGYIDLVNPKLLVPCHSANREAYVNNLERPYYWCDLKKTYVYDSTNNTLEVIND